MIVLEYRSGTPPTHTLLVGNIDQIPAFKGSGDNTWTDYHYQTLDQGGLPDVSLGRIPAHNDQELNAFIDKAIAREINPRNVDEILLTAGNDESLGCPANISQVGQQIAPIGATTKLVKKYMSAGASSQDVIGAYNQSPNIIVCDGHGNQDGMLEIPITIQTVNQLNNTSYPLILDIACLNANWSSGAQSRNFAEAILLKSNGGAAGIMASGGSGYGHDFFQTLGNLLAKGRQELGSNVDAPLNEIGSVIYTSVHER